MFAALGKFVVRARWWVIAAWIVAAVVIALTAPALQSTQDQSEFLPRHYESVKALTVQQEAFPERGEIGAIVVFDRADGGQLTEADQAKVSSIAEELNTKSYDNLGTAVAAPVSENGLVQAIFVQVKPGKNAFDPAAIEDARDLRADLEPLVEGTDLRSGVTGPAAQSLDSQESSEKALAIVSIVTLLLIVVLLALIFRSVIACVLPILTVALVGTTANGLIAVANEAFDLKADSSISVILFIVLFGIGTDYILFFLFRYREALRLGFDGRGAVSHAVERAGEAIASAGGAVIIAFMAMVLSSLSIFRSIGPALAIAVALAVLAALTLVPAVVAALGPRAISWPSKKWMVEPECTRFRAIGRSVAAHPVRYAVVSAGSLAAPVAVRAGVQPDLQLLRQQHRTDRVRAGADQVREGPAEWCRRPHVGAAALDGRPAARRRRARDVRHRARHRKGSRVGGPGRQTDDVAVFTVVLSDDPASDAALANVEGPVRDTAHSAAPDGTESFVGGTTSIFVDLDDAMARDYSVVFPVAAVLIMIILALLLRSLVAPVYLMLSVGLGFTASLGATVLVFQGLLGEQGLIFILPIYIYLFVVALGTDYNILMVARLREEAREGLEPRPGAAKAIEHAGPTVAAAGLILAGTFASLMFAEGTFFKSMGFSFSVGIALAAFVMALFLTPALTALLGHAAWWPGHGDRARDASRSPPRNGSWRADAGRVRPHRSPRRERERPSEGPHQQWA